MRSMCCKNLIKGKSTKAQNVTKLLLIATADAGYDHI